MTFACIPLILKSVHMKNRKRLIATVAIAGCVLLIGGIFAFSRDSSVFSNIFQLATYKTVATETFVSPSNWQTCQAVPKTVTVKNESTQAVVAKIKYDESWVASDRTTSLGLVDDTTNLRMAIVDRDNVDKWLFNEGDSSYYYYRPLEPGETTESFMKSVTLNCDASLVYDEVNTCTVTNGRKTCSTNVSPYASATYTLRATISTIQANAAREEWGYISTNDEATLLRGAAITGRIGAMTKIARADELPDNFPDDWRSTSDITIGGLRASTEASEKPVYMWDASQYRSWGGEIDESKYQSDTLYWYSQAAKIYYNPDMGRFLTDTSGGNQLADMSFYSQFDASRVVDLEGAFWLNGRSDFDWLSGWDVSNVVTMKDTFAGAGLTDLSAISGWNVSKVTDFSGMFQHNDALTSVSAIKNWNVRSGASFENMFYSSNSITDLAELSWLQ